MTPTNIEIAAVSLDSHYAIILAHQLKTSHENGLFLTQDKYCFKTRFRT